MFIREFHNKRGRRPSQSPASSQLVSPFEKGGQVRLASICPELYGCKRFSCSSRNFNKGAEWVIFSERGANCERSIHAIRRRNLDPKSPMLCSRMRRRLRLLKVAWHKSRICFVPKADDRE